MDNIGTLKARLDAMRRQQAELRSLEHELTDAIEPLARAAAGIRRDVRGLQQQLDRRIGVAVLRVLQTAGITDVLIDAGVPIEQLPEVLRRVLGNHRSELSVRLAQEVAAVAQTLIRPSSR